MEGGAADLASVATSRKSRFFQDFEEAAASLPVSPSASLPASPVHRVPAARAPINPAAAMPAPFLALRWVSLGLHARAAHDKLQQLSVTLARCAVQRSVPSPAQDPVSPPTPILDEVRTVYSLCLSCNLMCAIMASLAIDWVRGLGPLRVMARPRRASRRTRLGVLS